MVDDKSLYREFLKGNKQALEELVIKYKSNLIYFITRYVKNIEIAEDIFQDVIVFILENKEYYNLDYSFKTYLYMITKSKALDFIKKNKNVVSIDDSEFELEDTKLLEEIILTKERQKKIQNVMRKMIPEYQLIIYLTQVEGLSYKDAGLVMNKSESQIKTLSFNARKKLRKLMVNEKIVEIKDNKLIKLIMIFILIGTLISGITYAGIKLYKYYKTTMTPVYSGNNIEYDKNMIWVGSFQIAWNELIDKLGQPITFYNYESELANELNKKSFTKDMISEDYYYIKVSESYPKLKNEILNDIEEKFGVDNRSILNNISFEKNDDNIIIYSKLKKNFEFLEKFDDLGGILFYNTENKVNCFGINKKSNENIYKNIDILCYEEKNLNYYGVKLNTKNDDEIFLYVTKKDGSFEKVFTELENNSKNFNGNRKFEKIDELIIPKMNISFDIEYEELCEKEIKNTQGMYISKAIQNINFQIDASGGKVDSEALITTDYMNATDIDTRFFNFCKPFYIFIKEKNKEKPYFAMRIDNIECLEVIE